MAVPEHVDRVLLAEYSSVCRSSARGYGIAVTRLLRIAYVLTMSSLLSGCAAFFGTGDELDLLIAPRTTITDLATGEILHQPGPSNDTLLDGSSPLSLRKGKIYALKVSNDTATSYALFKPRRNGLSALNVLNSQFGLFVDQLLHADLDYDEGFLGVRTRRVVADSNQPRVEDSLRALVVPVRTGSVIDGRSYGVVLAWLMWGREGPVTQTVIGPTSGGIGFGVQVVPWVMPLYERGIMGDVRTGDMYDVQATWSNFGIQIQEPYTGAYATWRYGSMELSGISDADTMPTPNRHNANLNFYALSVGISGQWGRIEYRHRRNTAWRTTSFAPDLSGSYNGLHATFQVLL